ncbi:MAG: DUF4349 domain-containing protein [Chloroflexi bacterium]|nr:DUF4349 domain-containing protein [Chloroflexota bacterium]
MRRRLLAMISVLTVVLGSACAPGPSAVSPSAGSGPAESLKGSTDSASRSEIAKPASAPATTANAARPAGAAAVAGAPAAAPVEMAQQGLPGLDRSIIRTVTMTISVTNVQDAYRQVERIAIEQGGLVAGSQVRQEGERTTATVTVRVPADPATYATTLERLRGVAEKVVEEQSQGQDVTEELVDLDSRLRNLHATEDSLRGLLGRAQRIEDILQIQRELTTVRGQVEQTQGRKQALERRADLATITLQIREPAALGRNGWTAEGTVGEALRALAGVGRALLTLAIWLVVWLPLWGPALVGLWLLRRYARTARTGSPAPATGGNPA